MEYIIEFELAVRSCPCCGTKMMEKAKRSIFPLFHAKNQETQMKEKGIVFVSDAYQGEDRICEVCKKAGKASITCYICNEKKSSDLIEESFGCYPADYLCKDCYSTVPAKEWDEICESLTTEHKYDYY